MASNGRRDGVRRMGSAGPRGDSGTSFDHLGILSPGFDVGVYGLRELASKSGGTAGVRRICAGGPGPHGQGIRDSPLWGSMFGARMPGCLGCLTVGTWVLEGTMKPWGLSRWIFRAAVGVVLVVLFV